MQASKRIAVEAMRGGGKEAHVAEAGISLQERRPFHPIFGMQIGSGDLFTKPGNSPPIMRLERQIRLLEVVAPAMLRLGTEHEL